VINAAWEYAKSTKRRVSIEYILIAISMIKPSAPSGSPRCCAAVATGVGYT